MASAVSRSQPKWHTPSKKEVPVLKLQNSLTKTKTEFIPINGRRVTWYNCGPTVYDASHMGHARTYLTMDIIRRVLEDYFKYDVLFVQNVTDIDDKIILRARQQYLFQQLTDATTALDKDLVANVKTAWKQYADSKMKLIDPEAGNHWPEFKAKMAPADKVLEALAIDEKYKMHFAALDTSYNAIQNAEQELAANNTKKENAEKLLEESKDVVCLWLDKEKMSQVNDPKIFRQLPAYWEDKFYEDMTKLNVRLPDVQTRVSEYVPEIVEYVEQIIKNGYAYEAAGSVYFDTGRYDGHDGHHYAKLAPWSKGNQELIEDGEGSLGAKLEGKRSPNDFALWKSSKPGEPSWDSPWGKGRPGWHIECSVMAGAVLEENIDIHSGGVDLAFPHHDNEIAQSEAYYNCKQWVNYFLHAGHLHVEGQKMSKSLKNFISIQEALQKYSSRQLRMFYLFHQWDARMDFKDAGMHDVMDKEKFMNNFFMYVKAMGRKIREDGTRGAIEQADGSLTHRFNNEERDLLNILAQKQDNTHAALCDSINTPGAMQEILDLITQTNKYAAAKGNLVNFHVLEKVAKWITSMLKTFGVADNGAEIGFGSTSNDGAANLDDAIMPYLNVLSTFRDNVRQFAKEKKTHTDFLALSDKLRDDDLVELGVLLDDQEDGKALVKLVDKQELIKAREVKQQREAEKQAKKAQAAALQEQKRLERLEKGKLAPEQMFQHLTSDYSKFDQDGIPTHDKEGAEIAKSRRKKLQKEWEAQKKLHLEYQKSTQKE
ncbi:hypothetical protein NQZ79_g523 [Umbelopsis isabellina]|nr:hypothetical protein NQZ79_g523 [Umbelopsis isabellina]